ncbi:MAG: hypothetical protein J5760_04100 [Clostridia bacterium]|nr:hypothetical protein [Clostridia bacterium]
MTLRSVVIAATLAIACGIITVYYNSRFIGSFVRALLNIDALSPESAMSPEELGVKMTPPLRRALRPGKSLSNYVLQTGDGKYFVNPEKADLARKKYRDERATLLFVLLMLLVLCVFAVAASYIFPEVFSFATRKFTEIFGESR